MPLSNIYEDFFFLVALPPRRLCGFLVLEYELDVVPNIHRLAHKVHHYEDNWTEGLSCCPSLLLWFDIRGVHRG